MAEDLVKRLREAHANSTQRIIGSDIFEAAADLIEQQAASLAAKDKEIERLTRARDDLRQLYQGCDHLRDHAERALAEAVEVMRPFADFAEVLNEATPDKIAIGIFADGAMRFGPSGGANIGHLRDASRFIQLQKAAAL